MRLLRELSASENNIVDISPVIDFEELRELYLNANRIRDIRPIRDNPGINDGDLVRIDDNDLDCTDPAVSGQIEALELRGVVLVHDCD